VTTWHTTSPLRDFVSLRNAMDQLFEESFVRPDRLFSLVAGSTRTMPMEVYETDDAYVVKALVPGVQKDNLSIQYQDGALTLQATAQSDSGAHDDWTWHIREIPYGSFTRTVSLPKGVDVDRASAAFVDGVLTLTLPKAAEAKPRQITIGGAEPRQAEPHQIAPGGKSNT
jgi:HSP20 family protein